jgi:hypothetical protein
MTLQQLLDLNIIHDNVHILVDEVEDSGKHRYEEEFHVNRILGRTVTKEDLVKAGVREELFSYKVVSIWGDRHPFKMGVVIKEQKKKGRI